MGDSWACEISSIEKMYEKYPEYDDSWAFCMASSRLIYFCYEHFNIGIIRHEVRHAFIAGLCLDDADISVSQFEEINCVLDENRWQQMDNVSREIFRKLKEG